MQSKPLNSAGAKSLSTVEKKLDNLQWKILLERLSQSPKPKPNATGRNAKRNFKLAFQRFKDKILDENRVKSIDLLVNQDGDTLLVYACKHHDSGLVQLLISLGADVNHRAPNQSMPIFAVFFQKTLKSANLIERIIVEGGKKFEAARAIVALLVDHQVDIDADAVSSKGKITTLALAIAAGLTMTSRLLINYNAKVDKPCYQGVTPLFLAAQEGYLEMVKLLLEKGACVNVLTVEGETPLRTAAIYGHIGVMCCLLKSGADPNLKTVDNETILYTLCNFTMEDLKKLYSCQVSKAAIQKYQLVLGVLLSDKRTNLYIGNAKANATALALAIQKQNKFAFDKLIGKIDITKPVIIESNISSLWKAAEIGNKYMVKVLLSRDKSTINTQVEFTQVKGSTALYVACQNNHFQIVKQLLQAEANPDLCTKDGRTPLHIAAGKEHEAVVRILLITGNAKQLCTNEGLLPLHVAAGRGSVSIFKLLQQYDKKDINAQIQDGATALFFAAQEGHLEMVKYLLGEGANADIVRFQDKQSPLLVAYRKGHHEIVRVLLDQHYQFLLQGTNDEISYEVLYDVLLPAEGEEERRCDIFSPVVKDNQPLKAEGLAEEEELEESEEIWHENTFSSTHTQTGYQFLMNRGFTEEEISKLKLPAKAPKPPTKKTVDQYTPVTWFNGSVNSNDDFIYDVKSKDGSRYSLYLAKQALEKQKCTVSVFESVPRILVGPQGQQGIVPLNNNGSFFWPVSLFGREPEEKKMALELKTKAKGYSVGRVFLFREIADDGQSVLLIGAFFNKKGFHSGSKLLKSKGRNAESKRTIHVQPPVRPK